MNPGPAYTKIAKSAKAPVALLPLLPSCKRNSGSVRGTVILVTLCFVAVLGIALASYLAVCSRAMQLSNRAFQNELSKQLAEAAIEEGLRAFNKNNWDSWSSASTSVTWAQDTTNKRATATLTFPSTKFGQGVTAAVKIRVDNHDATQVAAPWSSSASYRVDDVVGYNGMWYRCVTPHTNQAPTTTGNHAYWIPAPIPWTWSGDITYSQYDVVNYSGVWYRCAVGTLTSSTAPSPTNTNWITIPANVTTWSSSTPYVQYEVVNYNGVNYRCILANTNQSPPNTTYWSTTVNSISLSWTSGTVYTTGAILYNSGSWYVCVSNHTSGATFGGDVASNKWDSCDWSSTTTYQIGDLVYRSGSWYTARISNLNQTPTVGTNWNSAIYSSTTSYSSGHVVFYVTDGLWYRYIFGSAATGVVPTNTTYWTPITLAPATWSSSTAYKVGDRVKSGGISYLCNNAHTNQAPPNKTYWTAVSFTSWQYLTKNYSFNDVSYYSGTWYRRNVNSTTVAAPTNTTYWENALSTSWSWSSSETYQLGDVVYYSSSFYRCIRSHSNQAPPNNTYWSADPLYSNYWDSGKSYGANDAVRYRGSWYLSLGSSNYTHRPGTDATYWAIAPRAIEPWSTTKTYHVDDLVSSGISWYRCLKDHTNQAVSSSTYWVAVAGSSYVWSSSTSYSSGAYVSYGGVWYKCIANTTANAGHTPNNTNYWTPTWSQAAGVTTGAPVVYADATVTLGDGSTSKAQLRAVIDPAPLFPNAAGANTTLTITGGTGKVDSYDSALPNASDTDGDNYVSTDAGYSAVLAAGTISASGTSTLTSIGASTTIQGYLTAPSSSSSPYAPRTSYATSVSLKNSNGTVTSPDTSATNVDLTRIGRTPYIPQFDILTPIQHTSIPTTLPTTTLPLNLGTPGAPTPSVYYFSTSLSVAASEKININGPVILRINGYLLLNTGTFNVSSTGSVVVHMNYVLRSYASAGGFQNKTKLPKNLLLISTNTTSPTTADYLIAPSSGPEFYGAIYMPNVTATLGMEIRTGVNVFGALSAREVTFSTEANLHYDTSLRFASFSCVDEPYTVTDWSELAATEQATMP